MELKDEFGVVFTETIYFDVELAAGKEFQHLTHKKLTVLLT